jgi:hypothetical protein
MKLIRTMAAAAALTALPGVASMPAHAHSRYGGSSYEGKPALAVTASLVQAGGGAAHYSTATALTSMVGKKLVGAEVAKLTKQYGKAKVASWLQIGDFAVKDALRIATKAGVKLPHGTLRGKQLASTLVAAGLEKDNTFNIELLLDKAVTHNIHVQVMDDIDRKFGGSVDANYHKISNQAFYDMAHALGVKKVKLNKFH